MHDLRSNLLFQEWHDLEYPHIQGSTNIFTRARLLLRAESFLCYFEAP